MAIEKGSRQLVVTRVGETHVGIDIDAVVEILPSQSVTPIPQTHPSLLGMLNVRGGVMPVADLRACLGFAVTEHTRDTRFVLVTYGAQRIGLVVDAVTEVMTVDPDTFQPVTNGGWTASSVRGVIRQPDRLVLEIDHERAIADGLGHYLPDSIGSFESAEAPGLNIDLLEASFALVARRGEELVETFYQKLFTVAPGVRGMFPDDMAGQKRALLGSLGTIVTSLRQPEKLTDFLTSLGSRHTGRGALAPHYDVVGGVLLETLAEIAGEAWNADLQAAWGQAYGAISAIMLSAAAEELAA